eukprot:TRINITY_DN11702_c0_g1_i60.p1 TRINITY_DN11702_c0_g1~~TRINITY_DN11702_c0_g1_i60.p1  ORF type:complete len:232 (+),score=35.71 TRINITY_DN11702_c0_g1_i60:68-763(+)
MLARCLLLTISLVFGVISAQNPHCQTVSKDGSEYDLSGINEPVTCTDSLGYQYSITLCQNTGSCGEYPTCGYCQQDDKWYYCVGTTMILEGQKKDGGKGVTIKSVEGEDGREGMVQITCDPNAGIMDDIQCTSSNGRLDAYKATFRSSLACPLPDTLSGGSIFMIILLVLLVVYWVVGLLVNRFYFGETSFEVLPNLAFWTSLPGLVKDGILFSLTKVRLLYEQVAGRNTE